MIHPRHMKYKLRVIAFHLNSLFLFDYLKSSRQTPEVKSLSAAGVLRQFPSDPHRSIHIERGTVFGCRCRAADDSRLRLFISGSEADS